MSSSHITLYKNTFWTEKHKVVAYIAHILSWPITYWMVCYGLTSPKYTTCHTLLFWVPFWPPHHTGCIIKWVPAGVWCPGERGENKACWTEKRPPCCHHHPPPPSLLRLSSTLPPPSNSLSMPSHDEGAVRAGSDTPGTDTDSRTRSNTADWKSPANRAPWSETYTALETCEWITFAHTRSHSDTYPCTAMCAVCA